MTETSKYLNKVEEELFTKFLLLRDIIYLEIVKYNEIIKTIEKLPYKNTFKINKKSPSTNLFILKDLNEAEIPEIKEYLHVSLAKLIMKKSELIREYCELDNISDDDLFIFVKSYIIKTNYIDSNLIISVSI